MRAVQVTRPGGPEVLELVDIPARKPGPGEVRVRTHTIGVGKPDVLFRQGLYRWAPPLPSVLGIEASGHVDVAGPGVADLQVGDPVLISYAPVGCYAEFVTTPVAHVVKLPPDFDLVTAVHIPNYVTAFALLTDACGRAEIGSLYVNGSAGGVGVAITQIARRRGITVIAGASSAEKCAFIASQGASQTIDYSLKPVVAEVMRFTGDRGVDLVLDHIVGPTFTDNLEMLAPMGTIVSFNVLGGLPERDLFRELRAHLPKSPAVRCFSGHVYDKMPQRLREIQAAVIHLLASGELRPTAFGNLPLEDARLAHQMLDSGKVLGKLVLRP